VIQFRNPLPLAAILILSALVTPALGQVKVANKVPRAKAPSYAALFKQLQLTAGAVGYLVIDARTGKTLAERQADIGFLPASSIKAPTAIAALNVLGGNHRFVTRLYIRGPVKNGTLFGDVILVGGGNPELTTDDYLTLIAGLKAKGVKRIKGRFIFDVSLFSEAKAIDVTHNGNVSYNSGVGPLSLNFNRLRLRWARTRGRRAPINTTVFSKTDKIAVPVSVIGSRVAPTAIAARYGINFKETGGRPEWLLSPRVRWRGEMWLPVKRPGLVAADVFVQFAKLRGLSIPAPQKGKAPGDAELVARHHSDLTVHITRRFLKFSNNMATEMMGMNTARKITGTPHTIQSAAFTLGTWYKKKLPNVNWKGFRLENHSGLSLRTRISPRQMVAILKFAKGQRYSGLALANVLRPYWIGQGRSARFVPRRMRMETVFRNGKRYRRARRVAAPPPLPKWVQVYGKTGTINYVRALAGYMTTSKKRDVVFAIFINDYRVREIEAKAGRRYKPMSSGRWSWRGRSLMRGIVRKWALEM
jgi:D-alanyl-D-alanine carboxypeptidase/D-alanyl-D-alanine-endopeptidase (penicillin-binding protein 4)